MPEGSVTIPNPLTIQTDDNKPLIISSKITTEELLLQIALQLYTYADFSKIQNPKDYASDCLYRANEFIKAYEKLNKN